MKRVAPRCARGVILGFVIAVCGPVLVGQQQSVPTQRDLFLFGVAMDFRDPALCQKIPPDRSGGGHNWSTPPGYQISYLQSECYYNLAGKTHDLSLCDHVRPLSTASFDGSKYNPEDCRLHSQIAPTIGGVDPQMVVEWMRKLGYSDADVHEAQYRMNGKNPVTDAYNQLRRETLFADRIKAAPSFDEPFAVAKARSANGLEYIYGMFASDSDQTIPCEKISPNAQGEWRDRKPFSLRLACFRNAAFNNRNLSYCDKLPVRSDLPDGTTDYDSRETCRQNVEALMQPDVRYTYGDLPPTFSLFADGLQKLGYQLSFPALTSRDYSDFVLYLSGRGADPVVRAEFLRRVEAME